MIIEKEFKKYNTGINKCHLYVNRQLFFEMISIDNTEIKNLDLSKIVVFHDENLPDDFDKQIMFKSKNGFYQKSEFPKHVLQDVSSYVNNHYDNTNGGLDTKPIHNSRISGNHQVNDWKIKRIKNIKYIRDNAIISYNTVGGGINYGLILGYIDKRGMWIGNMGNSNTIMVGGGNPHKIDTGLITNLSSIFEEDSTIVDFGCGNADYIKQLISEGFECEAYDGNPNTPEMTDGIGKVLDLSKRFDLGKKFDYVISLEVAEHIPKEYEEIYIDNLIRHTDYYLITSWGVKGQGGDGHVNEQDNDYVLNLYNKKGMVYQKEISEALRNIATLDWFKNTIFVFSKKIK